MKYNLAVAYLKSRRYEIALQHLDAIADGKLEGWTGILLLPRYSRKRLTFIERAVSHRKITNIAKSSAKTVRRLIEDFG